MANVDSNSDNSDSIDMDTTKSLATQALGLTVQEWNTMGQNTDDHTLSEAALFGDNGVQVGVDRVSALFCVRLAAIHLVRLNPMVDMSTSSLCRQALLADELPWPFLTTTIYRQVRTFVSFILSKYSTTNAYHNPQHAVTVVVAANKLLDMVVSGDSNNNSNTVPTFGLKRDPILLLALIFAALIHDTEHRGIANNQLVQANDELALLYNDQSVQENHSLRVAFGELLQPQYEELRNILFDDEATYRHFRVTVVSAVMATDLASPEQSKLVRAKWKEAFGRQPSRSTPRRSSLLPHNSGTNRRGSNYSEISEVTTDVGLLSVGRQSSGRSNSILRRLSQEERLPTKYFEESIGSLEFDEDEEELIDTPDSQCHYSGVLARAGSYDFDDETIESEIQDSVMAELKKREQRSKKNGGNPDVERATTAPPAEYWTNDDNAFIVSGTVQNPRSGDSSSGKQTFTLQKIARTMSAESQDSGRCSGSVNSFAANSIGVNRKRLDGGGRTRSRPRGLGRFSQRMKHPYASNSGEDSSLSLTPTSTGEEDDYRRVEASYEVAEPAQQETLPQLNRRASTGMRLAPVRKKQQGHTRSSSMDMVNPAQDPVRFRKRLGIRRSMDLSGETIEIYSKRGSMGHVSILTEPSEGTEEFNYLRASAVLEAILRTADAGHFFQDWGNMAAWSSRMFHERKAAHLIGRADDPCPSWFDYQLQVMDTYLKSLAQQLHQCGVFGEYDGPIFLDNVEANRTRWLTDGFVLTDGLIRRYCGSA